MNKIKIGVLFTYLSLFVNTLLGFIITPLMIRSLGDCEYAIYQLVVSISGYLTIVNIGTGEAMNRFVSMYKGLGENEKINNYVSMNLFITSILMMIVASTGAFVTINIGEWFPRIITSEFTDLTKKLCIIVICGVMVSFLSDAFAGLLRAYGYINKTKQFTTIKLIIRFLLLFALLKLGYRSFAIAAADLFLSVAYLIFILIMLKKECGYTFRFSKFSCDKKLLKENIVFSIASLLSSLSGQLNNNIDKTLLAIYCDSFQITIYTVATSFYIMFTSLGVSLNSVFLNKITEMYFSGMKMVDIEKFNIRIGRFQNFVVGMAFWGFAVLGKDFIIAWMGNEYSDIYTYAILIIVPSYLMCIGGVQETILDAKNKKMVSAIVVFSIGVLNVLTTIGLIKIFGGIGAPIGTSIALVLGYNIVLNIYIHKRIGINMITTYKNVFKGFLPSQLITCAISIGIFSSIRGFFQSLWITFILEGVIFTLLYIINIYLFALTKEEKQYIMVSVIKK